jgi:hypothetical protein
MQGALALGALGWMMVPGLGRADGTPGTHLSHTATAAAPAALAHSPRPADAPRWIVPLDLATSSHGLEPTALTVVPDGDVIAAASFFGALTVAGTRHDARGASDAILLRVGTDGRTRWAHRFGGRSSDAVLAIAPATDGGVFAAGAWSGAGADEPPDGSAEDDSPRFYLKRLDASGTPPWTAEPLGPHRQRSQINAIAPTTEGHVVVVGTFRGVLRLDARSRIVAP